MLFRRRMRRILIAAAAVGGLYLTVFTLIPRLLPWAGEEDLSKMVWSQEILDRKGRVIQVLPVNSDGLRRLYLPLKKVSRSTRDIIRISEDRRFFIHPGFDPFSLVQAALRYSRADGKTPGGNRPGERSTGGGSTITMQLVRMITPRNPEAPVNVEVKIREIWRALQIESRFSKREILELYISLVPFGRNIQGFPAAARLYYGRNLEELSESEICVLAVIPRSPVRLDPFTGREENLKDARGLAEKTLSRSNAEIFDSTAYLRLPASPAPWPFEAPHFCRWIAANMDDRPLEEKQGLRPVHTTLDLDMQKGAQSRLKYQVGLAGGFRISNGAIILANPQSMNVLAYVGSADFSNNENDGQIDGVRMLREPGSTLKPLLYAQALENGFTAATILPDIPMEFGGGFAYTPRNYNEQFHGPIRLRQALAASLNIPAVYTLERLGVENFTEMLISAGFESLDDQRGRLGVSLAIGGGEVSLAELLGGYGSLFAGGMFRPLRFFSDQSVDGVRLWSGETADIINDIISSPDDRVLTFGRRGAIRSDFPMAIKTGTSNQFNNIWAVGFTSDLIGAVWMGNFDGRTVISAPGSSLPATVLHQIFDTWSTKGELPLYTDLEKMRICSLSGMKAGDDCPYTLEEKFSWGTAPRVCSWHIGAAGGRAAAGDGSGAAVSAGAAVRYPPEYANWARRYGYTVGFSEDAAPGIISPMEGAVYYRGGSDGGSIRIRLAGSARSGPAVLRAGGRVIFQGDLPAELYWPLEEGVITFELEQGGKKLFRRIEVR